MGERRHRLRLTVPIRVLLVGLSASEHDHLAIKGADEHVKRAVPRGEGDEHGARHKEQRELADREGRRRKSRAPRRALRPFCERL